MAVSPPRFLTKLPVLIALFIIFLIGVGVGVYFYLQSTGAPNLLNQNTNDKDKEVKELVDKIGKIYDLPADEVPTIATVSDVTKLQAQDFFKRAQNGDKVLIFTNAKKAILYRPSTNKIVEVGPVNVADTDQNQNATPSAQTDADKNAEKTARVVLYNGTSTSGLTRRVETSLTDFDDVKTEVVARENANEQNYEETVVVDLTGANAAQAKALAGFVKGKTAALPKGETKPSDADILIILGQDYADSQ